MWQVTNQEQIAVNQGQKGKADYKLSIKLTWLSLLMGLTLSAQQQQQKGKLIFNLLSTSHVHLSHQTVVLPVFFCWNKYFEELRNNTSKGKNQFWQWQIQASVTGDKKKDIKKTLDIYITTHKALLYRHDQFELLYCIGDGICYHFSCRAEKILTFRPVKCAITKQVGRNRKPYSIFTTTFSWVCVSHTLSKGRARSVWRISRLWLLVFKFIEKKPIMLVLTFGRGGTEFITFPF